MTAQEEKRLDDLMSKPYPLTKAERQQLRKLLAKSRDERCLSPVSVTISRPFSSS